MAGSENETADSSSGEEEEEASPEGSLSESEPDKASTPPPSSKPPSNSSSDESGSSSDSDTEKPQSPDRSIKPLDDDNSKKPRSDHPAPLTGKRPAAEGHGGDSKRIKKNSVVVLAVAAPDALPDAANCGESEKKHQLFQRLWSEENEIELIKGMIDYVAEKGKDPLADVTDFHEFVKKSLHVDVNDKQLLTKARRLKKKYVNNAARVETKGKFRSLSNPHEKKMYELSKNLWGSDSNSNKNVVTSGNSKKLKVKVNVTPKSHKTVNEVEPIAVFRGLDLFGLPITDEVIMNKGLELLSGEKKVEMEAKWKNLKVQEFELFLKKLDVLKEQTEVVLNAIVKSGAK